MSEFAKFDEEQAVKFIRSTLSEEKNAQISDDEILYIIDCIWDWYEKNGYLAINADVTDEEELDVDKLVAYVKKELKRADEIMLVPEDVEPIVKAELQYEESIEDA
ncbi:MAG: hypothetical protein K2G67_02440 [Muribaculaceae bacterium]|nr:hypothetical protein [Muribaculaceae bacterium]